MTPSQMATVAETLTVAALQMRSGTNKELNVASALGLVHAAADAGATYIQLPEYFNFYGPARYFEDASEPVAGPTTRQMSEVARERRVTLHLGSVLEKSPLAGRPYNTSVLIGKSGEILATYQKVHLFDVDVPDEVTYHESAAITPGSQLVVAALDEFTLGLTICFDVRFAELYRALAMRGATVFAVPAIENHAFVVAATQSGTTDEGLATHGHAMIIDPWGAVLAESQTDQPEIVVATLDLSDVIRRRRAIDVLALRRPELYGEVSSVKVNES